MHSLAAGYQAFLFLCACSTPDALSGEEECIPRHTRGTRPTRQLATHKTCAHKTRAQAVACDASAHASHWIRGTTWRVVHCGAFRRASAGPLPPATLRTPSAVRSPWRMLNGKGPRQGPAHDSQRDHCAPGECQSALQRANPPLAPIRLSLPCPASPSVSSRLACWALTPLPHGGARPALPCATTTTLPLYLELS